MESNSQFNPQLQLTSQYYDQGDQYVRMFSPSSVAHESNAGIDTKPPALPPKPPTSYADQFVPGRHSRSSISGDTQWRSTVPVGSTKFTHSTNLQWDNDHTVPTNNTQWTNTATVTNSHDQPTKFTHPTNLQWDNNPAMPTNTQWTNTATVTSSHDQWNDPVTGSSPQWNSKSVTANQSLEVQQIRRENLKLRNEIEQLQQQLQQQQHQSINASANDAWMIQQNQQLHQQVAQLTQENDELRHKSSSMESELMVLQHSLKTHEEDFEQERRDRVRIHEEKERLQQELESQAQIIKMLTEEHGGKLAEMENNMGKDNNDKVQCQRCNRQLYANELFEHMQKCIQ